MPAGVGLDRSRPPNCLEGWIEFEGEIVPPDYYKALRAVEYPPITEFIDGMVKVHSTDPAIYAAGDAQIQAYCNACLAIKKKYPKP